MHRWAWTIGLIVVSVSCVSSHLCMWNPMQRGDFGISEPGYPGCYQKVGPCGVDTPGPITTLKAMQAFTVEFQQNLNHYYVNEPGWLDVSWAPSAQPKESDFQFLGPRVNDYNAMNEVTQTNFSVAINLPNTTFDHGVLRVRYVSNNPMENDRGMTFYQCADIKLVAGEPGPVPPVPPSPPSSPGSPCCTPKQFTCDFSRVDSYLGEPARGTIYYDATTQFMRVDSTVGADPTANNASYQFIMNFTSGVGYYYVPKTKTCPLRGLDYWNDWCYGTTGQNENFIGNVAYGDMLAEVWENGHFAFVDEPKNCIPLSLARSNGDTTIYYNFAAGAPDPSVFNPPKECLSHDQSLEHAPSLKDRELPLSVREVLKSLMH